MTNYFVPKSTERREWTPSKGSFPLAAAIDNVEAEGGHVERRLINGGAVVDARVKARG